MALKEVVGVVLFEVMLERGARAGAGTGVGQEHAALQRSGALRVQGRGAALLLEEAPDGVVVDRERDAAVSGQPDGREPVECAEVSVALVDAQQQHRLVLLEDTIERLQDRAGKADHTATTHPLGVLHQHPIQRGAVVVGVGRDGAEPEAHLQIRQRPRAAEVGLLGLKDGKPFLDHAAADLKDVGRKAVEDVVGDDDRRPRDRDRLGGHIEPVSGEQAELSQGLQEGMARPGGDVPGDDVGHGVVKGGPLLHQRPGTQVAKPAMTGPQLHHAHPRAEVSGPGRNHPGVAGRDGVGGGRKHGDVLLRPGADAQLVIEAHVEIPEDRATQGNVFSQGGHACMVLRQPLALWPQRATRAARCERDLSGSGRTDPPASPWSRRSQSPRRTSPRHRHRPHRWHAARSWSRTPDPPRWRST